MKEKQKPGHGASTTDLTATEMLRQSIQIRKGKRIMTGSDVQEYDTYGTTELTDKTAYDSGGSATSDPGKVYELRPK